MWSYDGWRGCLWPPTMIDTSDSLYARISRRCAASAVMIKNRVVFLHGVVGERCGLWVSGASLAAS